MWTRSSTVATAGVAILTMTMVGSILVPDVEAAQQRSNHEQPTDRCDFDADGFEDIVIGSPTDDAKGDEAGAFAVVYGSSDGFDTTTFDRWRESRSGVPGKAGSSHRFGAAAVCADFNGDGFGDVAVSSPGAVVKGLSGAGSVTVLFGSPGGISVTEAVRLTMASRGIRGRVNANVAFGFSLAAGDLDADGSDDLVIGAPGALVGDVAAGALFVVYGSTDTPLAGTTERWEQGDVIRGIPQAGDRLGAAVGVGDLDGDGYGDVVAAASGEAVGGVDGAGWLALVYGRPDLAVPPAVRPVSHGKAGIKGAVLEDAHLGVAVAIGDFDGDDYEDVAAAAPDHGSGGSVLVLYGSRSRTGTRDDLVRPSSVGGVAGSVGSFGWSLAGGDTNGDGYDELVIGVPSARVSGARFGGLVALAHGHFDGLSGGGISRLLLPGFAVGDSYGAGVSVGDHNGDGLKDILTSAPGRTVAGIDGAGELFWSAGKPSGAVTLDRSINRTHTGIGGLPIPGDLFGVISPVDAPVNAPAGLVTVMQRGSWTERSAVPGLMSLHTIDQITIHHAGSQTNPPTGPTRYRSWQAFHMDTKGWGDVAYHLIIGIDGSIYDARDQRYAGDTNTSYDPTGHLLIVLEGNFNKDQPSAAQLTSLVDLVAWGVENYDVGIETVSGHRDHAATACPGESLYAVIASGQLHDAVAERIAAGGIWTG